MKTPIEELGKVTITVEKDFHSISKEYLRLTIVQTATSVVYQSTTYPKGTCFISRKNVPINIQLNNREYWIPFYMQGDGNTEIIEGITYIPGNGITIEDDTISLDENIYNLISSLLSGEYNIKELTTNNLKVIVNSEKQIGKITFIEEETEEKIELTFDILKQLINNKNSVNRLGLFKPIDDLHELDTDDVILLVYDEENKGKLHILDGGNRILNLTHNYYSLDKDEINNIGYIKNDSFIQNSTFLVNKIKDDVYAFQNIYSSYIKNGNKNDDISLTTQITSLNVMFAKSSLFAIEHLSYNLSYQDNKISFRDKSYIKETEMMFKIYKLVNNI